jgi:hypothetical protein
MFSKTNKSCSMTNLLLTLSQHAAWELQVPEEPRPMTLMGMLREMVGDVNKSRNERAYQLTPMGTLRPCRAMGITPPAESELAEPAGWM